MSLYVDIEKRLGAFRLRSKFEAENETLALLGAWLRQSVTLWCIAGIMTPDRGRIVLNGRVLFDSEKTIDLTPQQRRVGYLFQQYALFPNMTVEQNILCGIRAGSRSEKRALAAEKLHMFRLEGWRKSIPRSSPADSSSASRSPASSAPSRRRSCSTSPSPRSTATSSGTLSWSSPTCSRAFTVRSSGSATTWGNAAATAKRSA